MEEILKSTLERRDSNSSESLCIGEGASSVSYLFRKRFGLSGTNGRDYVDREKLPHYAGLPTSEHHEIPKLHLVPQYWEAFRYSLGQFGVDFTNKNPWQDEDVMSLQRYANNARVRANDFITRHIIEPASLGIEKRILICPPWASMTVDWTVNMSRFSSSAISLIQEEGEGSSSLKNEIKAWLVDATKEKNQKRRHAMSPENVKKIVDHMRSELEHGESGHNELSDSVGGYGSFTSQAMFILGGRAVLGVSPDRVPKHLFDQCEFPFTMVDDNGAVHAFTPEDADHGNPDLIGNINVETTEVPHTLELLANLVGCDAQTIRQLSNFADTSSVLNGGLPAKLPSKAQIEALVEESKNCFAGLYTGFQKITNQELSDVFFNLLERLECPIVMDFTPPPTEVAIPANVSASIFNGVRQNANKIKVVSFNVSDSGHVLDRLEEAIQVDASLAESVNLKELENLKTLFKSNSFTVQDGEHPQYIFELSIFLADLLGCPVRARARSIDIAAYPTALTKEECSFVQDMNTGSRLLGVKKASNEKGFPRTTDELQPLGIELHPRNFAGLFVTAHVLTNQMSIKDSISQNMSWIVRREGKNPITVVTSIAEEFVADSPSKISVGDYMTIIMALVLGKDPQEKGKGDPRFTGSGIIDSKLLRAA